MRLYSVVIRAVHVHDINRLNEYTSHTPIPHKIHFNIIMILHYLVVNRLEDTRRLFPEEDVVGNISVWIRKLSTITSYLC
jgi:hypothetical protein